MRRQNASGYVVGLTLAAVTLLWSLWTRYKSRIKFLPTGTHSFSLDDFAVDKASRDHVWSRPARKKEA